MQVSSDKTKYDKKAKNHKKENECIMELKKVISGMHKK